MPATSKAQQRYFKLVKLVQDKKINKEKVSPAVKKTAKKMSKVDVNDMVDTNTKNLPERKRSKK